jgi:hypothetical protein
MSISSFVNPINDYHVNKELYPRYRYTRVALNNVSGNAIQFQPSSNSLMEFRIPSSSCINIGRSFVAYSLPIPASAAGGGNVNQYTIASECGVDFSSVQFTPGSGLDLVNVNYINKYVSLINPYKSHLENDYISGCNDQLSKFYCSKQSAVTNLNVCSLDGLTTLPGVYQDPSPFWGRQNISISPQPNTAITLNRQIPLSVFKNTLLSQDVDIWFPCDMFLRFQTAPLSQVAVYNSLAQAPGNLATQTLINTTCTTTSCYLYLAVQENVNIRESLIRMISSRPMSIPIPWLYLYRTSQSNSTSQLNANVILTKSFGRQLTSLQTSVWNVNEYSLLCFDANNLQGNKLNLYQTSLDGRSLQDQQLSVWNPNAGYNALIWPSAPADGGAGDWRQNRDFIQGSSITSYSDYMKSWCHFDNFGVMPFKYEDSTCLPHVGEASALPLDMAGDHVWSLIGTCTGTNSGVNTLTNSAGSITIVAAVFSRTLTIASDGVTLSN